MFGDVTLFLGKPGVAGNCALQSRFKRGDPVGFRMTAIDPVTGQREPSAQFVVHLTYGGMTQDLPMRYRATVKQPEREFWVAKWVVPDTAPIGHRPLYGDRDGQVRPHGRIQALRRRRLPSDDRGVGATRFLITLLALA